LTRASYRLPGRVNRRLLAQPFPPAAQPPQLQTIGTGARMAVQSKPMFAAGERVRVNLAGLKVKHVLFQAAVTDAVGDIVKKTSDTPPMYLVRLLFSFKGVDEVEVPEDRVRKF
jgi:hypothetical protein